jgi:acetyl-CoA carboxylase biotin carboxyl carrier protein
VRRTVLEVELDFANPVARADRIDRHPGLQPEPSGERDYLPQDLDAHRALTRERGLNPCPGGVLHRSLGKPQGDAKPAADPAAERADREIAVTRLDLLDEWAQPARGGAEVTVAEEDHVRRRLHRAHCQRPSLDVRTLAMRLCAIHHLRAVRECDICGAVGRRVVRDDELRPRKDAPERVERLADPIGLIPRRDDHREPCGRSRFLFRCHGRLFCRRAMANVEAHITGTVWKIEVAVGDDIEEGDTVVILESMKMEMPVEAEDDGKVSEIRCEEGQSVQEGDVLVVLE